MKRVFGVLAILMLLFANFAAPVSAQEAGPLDESPAPVVDPSTLAPEGHNLWFIEFGSSPLADGGSAARVAKDKNNFRAAAQQSGIPYSERFAFDTLWNGISVQASGPEINRLARLPGVKAVYPVVRFQVPPNEAQNIPELASAIAMTGADLVQNELGFTGKGVKVAVMDTGIDYDHPDLGGCFGPGCRVAMGWDFVGDAYNADDTSPTYNPVPSPDPLPDDCNGHGSHVAGIIGANGEVKGVAPEVTFGAYRVFGCDGSTDSDIMLAAMQRALDDGMQVLNMSIGSAFQWPQYPTAQAADRLVTKGMVVVASIGNSGTNGPFAAGAPGLGKKVIGVASFDNTRMTQFAFAVSGTDMLIGYTTASAAPPTPFSGTYPLTRTGTQTTPNDGCAALPEGSLADQIALIRRGTCGFYNKALNAQNAGAAGVVLYNNQPGSVNPTVAPVAPLTTPITIPVVMISQVDGNALDTLLAAGPQDLTWTDQTVSNPVATAGLISSFSSFGLSPDLTLKPDIGAPGGNIWSTYPLEEGGYANLGGTSMSSPHVAGAVALLLQARPNLNPSMVRTLLLNTADPKLWSGNPGLGYLELVHRQGAGMLDIFGAIQSYTFIEPSKLSLGEIETGSVTQTLTIKNATTDWKKYSLWHVPALATGPNSTGSMYFTYGTYGSFATAAFSQDQVAVPPMGSVKVDVTITRPAADMRQFGGYIVITQVNGTEEYTVPYAGFSGDYQSISPMLDNPYELPYLLKDGYVVGIEVPENPVYTLVDGDVPVFWVQMMHQARSLSADVFMVDAKGRSIPYYRAFYEDYMPRNATAGGIFEYAFNGTTMAGNTMKVVPDGQYYIVIKVLKALGDPNNPAHYETWTSPLFTIDRP